MELFPDRRTLYQQENSIWNVLFDLLPMAVEAHRENNIEALKAIYRFTEWCHEQKKTHPEFWEAASAAFYEHLVDDVVTLEAIPDWVSPEVFQDMREQFARQMADQPVSFQELVREYNKARGTNFS